MIERWGIKRDEKKIKRERDVAKKERERESKIVFIIKMYAVLKFFD